MPDFAGLWADLGDLVLPAECAGCRSVATRLRQGVCADCAAELRALRPRSVRPTPAPPGLPPCVALGPYEGALRESLLTYKDRGRHGLARPLGALLAEVVAAAVGQVRPVLLIGVPDTAAAARARYGDHLDRLTRQAATRLRTAGWPVRVLHPLVAAPRADSAGLGSADRARAAEAAFRLRSGAWRPRPSAPPSSAPPRSRPPTTPLPVARSRAGRSGVSEPVVVVLDDILTTGATLAAVSRTLRVAGLAPSVAAVLAATRRRHSR